MPEIAPAQLHRHRPTRPSRRPRPQQGPGENAEHLALIARAQAGESAALEALLVEHDPLIRGMATR